MNYYQLPKQSKSPLQETHNESPVDNNFYDEQEDHLLQVYKNYSE